MKPDHVLVLRVVLLRMLSTISVFSISSLLPGSGTLVPRSLRIVPKKKRLSTTGSGLGSTEVA